jgi:hypothetical protein
VESRSIEGGKGNPGPIEVCWNPRAQLEIIWQKNLVPLAGELEQGEGTQYHLGRVGELKHMTGQLE